jgi:2-polyprenyl-3-methyl-5-hydroxy-6-metoxy-1,4-benzoquinol methylase
MVGSCVITNVNSLLTLTLWIVAIYLAIQHRTHLFLLLPLGILVLNELLYAGFNLDGLNGPARTKLFYDITTTYFIQDGNNTNLTEGMYLKDIHNDHSIMTAEEANQLPFGEANLRKFQKFFLYLDRNLDYSKIRILDMGCGNGDFIKYCKSLGIQASGMSISKEQVKQMKKDGLDVYLGSYRELQPQFIGKYDIVTFWGSLEHMTQSYPCSKSGEKKAEKMIQKIMSHVKQYYHPSSPHKLLFNTTLHLNRKICKNTMNAYILERAYGGWYFYDEPKETLADKIQPIGFNKLKQADFTYHYYLATKIDLTHFGRPAEFNFYNLSALLFGALINPSFIFMSLYTLRGEWMWQFDNRLHTDESCDSCTIVERDKRPTTLLWSLSQLV